MQAVEKNFRLLSIDIGVEFVESTIAAKCDLVAKRNEKYLWRNMHGVIFGVCLAMHELALPDYVLLWIIDWIEEHYVSSTLFRVPSIQVEFLLGNCRAPIHQDSINHARS